MGAAFAFIFIIITAASIDAEADGQETGQYSKSILPTAQCEFEIRESCPSVGPWNEKATALLHSRTGKAAVVQVELSTPSGFVFKMVSKFVVYYFISVMILGVLGDGLLGRPA